MIYKDIVYKEIVYIVIFAEVHVCSYMSSLQITWFISFVSWFVLIYL